MIEIDRFLKRKIIHYLIINYLFWHIWCFEITLPNFVVNDNSFSSPFITAWSFSFWFFFLSDIIYSFLDTFGIIIISVPIATEPIEKIFISEERLNFARIRHCSFNKQDGKRSSRRIGELKLDLCNEEKELLSLNRN